MFSPAAYIILSTQRVGSHLLGGVVGSHPDFAHAGEVLMRNTPKPGSFDVFMDGVRQPSDPALIWRDYLGHLQKMQRSGARYVGFLVKYGDVDRIDGRDLTSDSLFDEVRIIHLIRRNILRMVASHHLAVARKLHVTSEIVQHEINSVELPADEIVRTLRKKAAAADKFRRRLAGRRYVLEVAYEDILDGGVVSDQLVGRLCKFFDVTDEFVRAPKTVKLAPEHLTALISNFDEVATAVSGTEFQEMLD
jgi:LPS sulfotransferase NodH